MQCILGFVVHVLFSKGDLAPAVVLLKYCEVVPLSAVYPVFNQRVLKPLRHATNGTSSKPKANGFVIMLPFLYLWACGLWT